MKMIVNGVDFLPYIAHNGLKWQLSDVDGPGAGRLADGSMQRDRVATKVRFDLTFRPLKKNELSSILSAVRPEFYNVEFENPITGKSETGSFYSNNYSLSLYGVSVGGEELFTGLVLPVIQR